MIKHTIHLVLIFLIEKCSVLIGIFVFSRQIRYFILEIYVPCILVVLVSWIGFYLDREDAVDRASLGKINKKILVLLIISNLNF